MTTQPSSRETDRGSALIIALIFVAAFGLVLGSIAAFASSTLTNTINLKNQRAAELEMSNAVQAAMQNVRRTYTPSIYTSSTGVNCLPNNAPLPQNPFYVYCVGAAAPGSIISRTVNFYACASSVSCVGSPPNSLALYAVALYDDVPPNATPTGYSDCGPSAVPPAPGSTCGIRMTVAAWDLKVADS